MSEAATEEKSVPVIETAIAEYSPTAAALADLKHRFSGVIFDVTTAKGDKEARAARLELVRLRTGLEAKRREIKAPALARAQLIDTEAKRINAFITELEDPIDEQIRVEEKRKEGERQAKLEAEQRRVQGLMSRIDEIRRATVIVAGTGSSAIEAALKELVALPVDETFAEFRAAADNAKTESLQRMREAHTAALAHEAEQQRLKDERAELARLRAEEKKRADEEAAARKVEHDRIRAEQQAEADRLAAARREIEQREAAQRAERQRLDDEARAQREEQDRIAREARLAEQRRLDEAAAALRRQQAHAAAEKLRRDDEAAALQRRQESERLAAEQAARTKLQAAAQPMFDALLLWRTVDAAKLARTTDAYKQAAAAREAAIAAATN